MKQNKTTPWPSCYRDFRFYIFFVVGSHVWFSILFLEFPFAIYVKKLAPSIFLCYNCYMPLVYNQQIPILKSEIGLCVKKCIQFFVKYIFVILLVE